MKNRFIYIILALFIFTFMGPKPVEAKALVRNIDGVFDDFKLQVEGKNISSKEVFIYDGELWVPLKDLGKALGLEVSLDLEKRLLAFNSKGSLNIHDSSKAHIAYQRGYEILAKERIIGELEKEIQSFEGKKLSKEASSKSLSRNISVGFSNIQLYLDGKKLDLSREPFIYNNDIYASLVELSPILYITPSLKGSTINIDSNSVLVKKQGYDSVEALASFRDGLNNRLAIQLAEMEKRRSIIMDVKIPYEKIASLKAMENYLNKHLGKISDIPVSIGLRSGTDHWYSIDIGFSSSYNSKWKELSRRDVESYIWDIFVAISSLYDEDAKIQGTIKNPNSASKDKNHVEFDTRIKDLIFNFSNSNLDMNGKVDPIFIEDILSKALGKYSGESFKYSARLSGYDLDLRVEPASSDYMKKWSLGSQLRFLRDIDYEIKRHYPGLKINGMLEYPGEETVDFQIDKGGLSSSYLMGQMEFYLNKNYGVFRSAGLRVDMAYDFNRSDRDNYKLIVNMDFNKDDPSYNSAAEEALGSFLQVIIKDIISLWDVNVFVQVYDKDQALVMESVIAQDMVQAVNASPPSGDIEEGRSVSLYSSTSGADIYYTINGINPSQNNRIKYTGPIRINKDTLIKAYAVKEGLKDSPVYEFKYNIIKIHNMAQGLDALSVDSGNLEPDFKKDQYDYVLNLESSVSSISIIPSASKGSISINGRDILSGKEEKIPLGFGETEIQIRHREDGKVNRVYTILVNREKEKEEDKDDDDDDDEEISKVELNSDYTLRTSILGVFKGSLTGSSSSYDGYSIELRSGDSGQIKLHKRTNVNRDGSFQISGFSIDFWDKYNGYSYRILDKHKEQVDSGNLRVQN